MDIIVEVTGAGGATNIQALTDVNTSGAVDGQVLTYDSTTSMWIPTAASGVTTLAALNDTDVAGGTDGQVLTYNATSGNFELADPTGSSGGSIWGSITGTLSSQTDLQTALDAKANSNHTHTKSQITDFSDSDYATAAQGTLAGSAVQPGDNVSDLTNDAGYLTSAPVLSVAGKTGAVTLTEADISDLGTYLTSAPVDSVAGKTGAVTLTESDITDLGSYITDITNESLTDLSDVPANLTGQAGKLVKVNPTEDGFIYGDPSGTTVSWGDIAGTLSNQTDLQSVLDAKAATTHTHVEADITDLDKFTQAEVTTLLTGKANSVHTHVEADITDLDKYTQAEVDVIVATKSDTGHTHTKSEITDFSDADYATAAQGATADTALQNVVEDTTPELGGDLNTNGNAITDTNSVNVNGERLYTISTTTSNATPTVSKTIAIGVGARITFTLQGSAIDSATGDTFGFILSGCARNQAGTSSLAGGTVLTEFKELGATAWDIQAVVNDTTDQLQITVTGEAAHNLSWDYVLRTVEI